MTGADKAIRWSTVGAVSVVALVAAFVSYRHALAVIRLHGEGWPVLPLYPLTIDGLIYAASMVLLDCARHKTRPPALAYFALGLGIAATLAANVAAGLAYGVPGAVVAAWPAPALVISYELLMFVIRSAAETGIRNDMSDRGVGTDPLRTRANCSMPLSSSAPGLHPQRGNFRHPDPTPALTPLVANPGGKSNPARGEICHPDLPPAALNGHAAKAAELYSADLAAGTRPSIRQIRKQMHVGQPRAQQIRAYLESL